MDAARRPVCDDVAKNAPPGSSRLAVRQIRGETLAGSLALRPLSLYSHASNIETESYRLSRSLASLLGDIHPRAGRRVAAVRAILRWHASRGWLATSRGSHLPAQSRRGMGIFSRVQPQTRHSSARARSCGTHDSPSLIHAHFGRDAAHILPLARSAGIPFWSRFTAGTRP